MALFLGLELAVDQLRATVVDEQLEIVQAHSVDFDAELGYGSVNLTLHTCFSAVG